jgi:hypothetical protein
MRFLPKKHFQWREPKAFLKLNDAIEQTKLRWWSQPLWTLIATAMFMGQWYVASINPRKDPPPFLAALSAAFIGGLFFGYGLPWLISLCPSDVYLYNSYLIRSRGKHQQIQYSEIASFSWTVRDGFAALVIKYGKRHREVLIGVPDDVSQKAVTKFLSEQGVPQRPEQA